jgi:hypothetical protein
MGIIASVDRGLVDGLRTLNRMDDGALRPSDVGTTGRLLFSVKSALAKPVAVTVSPHVGDPVRTFM